ncbi:MULTISPECIES: beta-glucoside-specific PTS transporter subunit IIABC [unclassified Luteococcus]|uniref:beta-glucoside-specific PTS transporter subunit IIABC n=1 Tax=unclassified Luteococcus TaxID=2639923 RepID=UPI00313DF3A5
MASVDYRKTAEEILATVGGEANVASVTHCATRLRLKLRDESLADDKAVEKIPGVITVMKAGGQYQVVVGNNVPKVYAALGEISKLTGDAAADADTGPKGNLLNQFIQLISSLFLPLLWPMAGAGLYKAFLAAATTFKIISTTSTTYTILNASADALFNFLPIFLAFTAAKRFKANQFTAMAIGGALVYPSIVALNTAGTPVEFFGLPVTMMSYVSSVIPIIIGVYLQSHLERLLSKLLPDWLRNFMTPLVTIAIMVPLILITVGPVTIAASNGISAGVNYLFRVAPWAAGAIMGGLWQVFVLFGLHWGFVPIILNDLTTQGYTKLSAPLVSAVLAQAAAATAVALRTRSKKRRDIATAGTLSGFVAGVTEPVIYGVNLPLKKPFYFGIAGGTVGGMIAAMGGNAADQFVFPSLLGLAGFTKVGSFAMQLIGCAAAVTIAFVLTLLFVDREQADEVADVLPDPVVDDADATPAPLTGRAITLGSPVAGTLVPLTEVPDKVFASGAMGSGFGVAPTDGTIVAPCDGEIIVSMKSGHAFGIRSPQGAEVLVHVGIDTVQMKGEGFVTKVAKGETVSKGQPLCTVDLAKVAEAGFDPTTIVVVTNTATMSEVTPGATGPVTAGADACVVIA